MKNKSIIDNVISDKIIACFNSDIPDSINIGGSYSKNEFCRIDHNGYDYWLSDIDLICVVNNKYNETDIQYIYNRLLTLSRSINQSNPYFHIGLKLRKKDALLSEVKSMYFWELLDSSIPLKGPTFKEYFPQIKDICDLIPKGKSLYKLLYNYSKMRLWCNILFLPLRIFEKRNIHESIWYSYFLARGVLDWITWDLLEIGIWENSYNESFNLWSKYYCKDESYRKFLSKCLECKIGESYIPFHGHYEKIINYELTKTKDYGDHIQKDLCDVELEFIRHMLLFIIDMINKIPNSKEMQYAITAYQSLAKCKLALSHESQYHQWQQLRILYSNYRFSKDYLSWQDHNVYTSYFLNVGGI
ncbi:MAG: hypothetical protein GY839_19515 [candidate division Zixibacteria bacterium]|nr:hypothetical protein [candidate division Zixibacteria bacterium]